MNTRLLAVLIFTAFLSACSSTPDRNNALEQARNNFNAAQNTPEITTLASDELKRAEDSLRRAERAWNQGDKDNVDHLAYLADQRVTIAKETASNRASQAIIRNAGTERDRMRLDLRTSEAERAKQRLSQVEASAAQERERAAQLEAQLKELDAKQTARGMVVTLGDVLFDTGKAELQPGAQRNITKLGEFLKENPETRAEIEGHTDSTGSASFNYNLSQRRADAVRAALQSQGISGDRLTTRAHGPDMPVADNNTAAGRQLNRRVEIIFPRPAN